MPEHRHQLTSAAIRWCALSVAWAAFAGTSSFVAGLAASSIALVAFGASSLLDGTASGVLVWGFRHEQSGADVDAVERRAAFAVGVVMSAVALYLGVRAVNALAEQSGPETSRVGIVLTAASAVVLPLLARAKLRLAARLRSPGLRGDGVLSLAGAVLAATTLLSLVVDVALDWWWADSVAACWSRLCCSWRVCARLPAHDRWQHDSSVRAPPPPWAPLLSPGRSSEGLRRR